MVQPGAVVQLKDYLEVRLESFRYKISESLTAVVKRVSSSGSSDGVFCSFSSTLIAAAWNSATILSLIRVLPCIPVAPGLVLVLLALLADCNGGLLNHGEAHNQGSHNFEG